MPLRLALKRSLRRGLLAAYSVAAVKEPSPLLLSFSGSGQAVRDQPHCRREALGMSRTPSRRMIEHRLVRRCAALTHGKLLRALLRARGSSGC
ncbi:hypothetical protein B0H67DRAFT_586960 [Lasiosphaeris hirsuta]|uniref:Uncharacterized protein n=1 Tax=Lasiosphaeris hirsuta TaxID=260670 RepID=A0AA40DQS9_9PEZI|nr:hypothetical protein B0H67DRAFT_586960 [Lasiosphaeris hirsuta]